MKKTKEKHITSENIKNGFWDSLFNCPIYQKNFDRQCKVFFGLRNKLSRFPRSPYSDNTFNYKCKTALHDRLLDFSKEVMDFHEKYEGEIRDDLIERLIDRYADYFILTKESNDTK